jgi:hypothetical protein
MEIEDNFLFIREKKKERRKIGLENRRIKRRRRVRKKSFPIESFNLLVRREGK